MKSIFGLSLILLLLQAGAEPAARAADAPAAGECAGFKWDISREHALFVGEATHLDAGKNPDAAPTLATERLYELELAPQTGVTFVRAPGKKMLTDGAFAGLANFKVPTTGTYRVSLDVPFWIDVVDNGNLTATKDFGGQQGCLPHKIVEYELTAGQPLVLQASASSKQIVRLTVTLVTAR